VVAKGLPDTDAAREQYAKAKEAAVRWAKEQIKLEGLDDRLTVRDEDATAGELLGGGGK
jgi:hypothetical protein